MCVVLYGTNANLLFQYYIKRNETQSHGYQMICIHHSMVKVKI